MDRRAGDPSPVLEVRGVVKTFGAFTALDHVGLTVAPANAHWFDAKSEERLTG